MDQNLDSRYEDSTTEHNRIDTSIDKTNVVCTLKPEVIFKIIVTVYPRGIINDIMSYFVCYVIILCYIMFVMLYIDLRFLISADLPVCGGYHDGKIIVINHIHLFGIEIV